jgi:hypothetical protein
MAQGAIVTIEEIKQRLDRAVAVFDDVNLFPAVRVRGAYEYLAALGPERDDLSPLLRGQFDELWAVYAVVSPMTEFQIERCERLTRDFAQSLAAFLPAPEAPAEDVPEEEPKREEPENGRAAADQ